MTEEMKKYSLKGNSGQKKYLQILFLCCPDENPSKMMKFAKKTQVKSSSSSEVINVSFFRDDVISVQDSENLRCVKAHHRPFRINFNFDIFHQSMVFDGHLAKYRCTILKFRLFPTNY